MRSNQIAKRCSKSAVTKITIVILQICGLQKKWSQISRKNGWSFSGPCRNWTKTWWRPCRLPLVLRWMRLTIWSAKETITSELCITHQSGKIFSTRKSVQGSILTMELSRTSSRMTLGAFKWWTPIPRSFRMLLRLQTAASLTAVTWWKELRTKHSPRLSTKLCNHSKPLRMKMMAKNITLKDSLSRTSATWISTKICHASRTPTTRPTPRSLSRLNPLTT